jgi:glutathione S-transferase
MKLYVTSSSPYARIARIVVNEKGLRARVEILIAPTRSPRSPYYEINASGRVPYLVRDDGVGMEHSDLIAAYLDHIDGNPTLYLPPWHDNWEYGRLEARARSLIDGLAVLVREMRRAEGERSPSIIEHEQERSRRLANTWETEIRHPLMQDGINMAQIVLISAVLLREHFSYVDLLADRLRLTLWAERLMRHPSVRETMSNVLRYGPNC